MSVTWYEKIPEAPWSVGTDAGYGCAYDSARGVTVFFASTEYAVEGDPCEGYKVVSQTLEWDGTCMVQTNEWSWDYGMCTSPPSIPVPLLWSAPLAYDVARANVVLYGGNIGPDFNGTTTDQTWTYSGGVWTLQTPAASPPARFAHSMAYDAVRDATILFGGTTETGFLNDTWKWDGTTWTQLFPTHSPSARTYGMMCWDPVGEQIILFGGDAGGDSDLNDTWAWDGTDWTELSPATSPSARSNGAGLAGVEGYGPILFGGYDPGSGDFYNDTWQFTGGDWVELLPGDGNVTPPLFVGSLYQMAQGAPGTQPVYVQGGPTGSRLIWDWTPATSAATGDAPSDACTANLEGTVDPSTYGDVTVSWYFEWGLTDSYGNETAGGTASGTSGVSVSDTIGGIINGTTYHYRLVVDVCGTLVYGDDATFVAVCPAGSQPFFHHHYSGV